MRRAVVAAVLAAAAAAALAQETERGFTAEQLEEARAEFVRRLEGVESQNERAERVVAMALLERPGGALGHIVEEAFRTEAPGAPQVLYTAFRSGEPYAQRRVLELYRERWEVLGRGNDPWRTEMVRRALESPHEPVWREAARLAATRPVHRIGHSIIDATLDHPELTIAALLAVGGNGEHVATRWVLDQAAHEDPAVRQAARWALHRLGRAAAPFVRERIEAAEGERRGALVELLLLVAGPDDLGFLYRWLEDEGGAFPAVAEAVAEAASRIEIGVYEPARVDRPELDLAGPRGDGAGGAAGG